MHEWSNELNNEHSNYFFFHHPNNVGYGKLYEPQIKIGKYRTPEQVKSIRSRNKFIREVNMVKRILVNNVYNEDPLPYYGFRYGDEQVYKAINANTWGDKYSYNDKKHFLKIGTYLNRNASHCNRNGMINDLKAGTAKGCSSWLYENQKRVEDEIEKYLHPQDNEDEYDYGRVR